MQIFFSWFLARRFLGKQQPKSLISTMVWLCTAGIALGTGAVALALAITSGFDTVTLTTLQGMSPDLIIRSSSREEQISSFKITTLLKNEYAKDIVGITECSTYHALLQHEAQSDSIAGFTLLHSINPATFETVITIPFSAHCTSHKHRLHDLTEHTIIVGSELAQKLGVTCGSLITIRYPAEEHLIRGQLFLDSSVARVVGIFCSGVEDWDAHSAFISHSYANMLFSPRESADYMSIKIAPTSSASAVQKRLSERLRLDVVSWKDLNPMLISALKLERLAVLCIVGLILVIAGAAIMALLCMLLLYHERTIAILLAHGMKLSALQYAFTIYTLLLTLRASCIGLCCATCISYLLDQYQLIKLPEMYYSAYLPAHMSLNIIVLVTVFALITSLCAIWYPLQRLRAFSVVQILMRS